MLPRISSRDLYQQKYSALFERVYESYPERDAAHHYRLAIAKLPATHRNRRLALYSEMLATIPSPPQLLRQPPEALSKPLRPLPQLRRLLTDH